MGDFIMNSNSIKIEPNEFAMAFIKSLHLDLSSKAIEQLTKDDLAAYLSAYFLIERFNNLDAQNFNSNSELDWHQLSFTELLNKVSALNKY